MSFQNNMFQPGAILHEVIVGSLKTNGSSLQEWARQRGLSVTAVRNITFGMSAGVRSRALLDQLIDHAGREVVAAAYRQRMAVETRKLAQVA